MIRELLRLNVEYNIQRLNTTTHFNSWLHYTWHYRSSDSNTESISHYNLTSMIPKTKAKNVIEAVPTKEYRPQPAWAAWLAAASTSGPRMQMAATGGRTSSSSNSSYAFTTVSSSGLSRCSCFFLGPALTNLRMMIHVIYRI